MLWGLVPPWSKGDKYQPIVNLRAETVLNRPAFNRFLQQSRCIVPADGFFEWRAESWGNRRQSKGAVSLSAKSEGSDRKLWIRRDSYHDPIARRHPSSASKEDDPASIREGSRGKELQTFCLITTEPTNWFGQVHNRMPVIIPHEKEKVWLNSESQTD